MARRNETDLISEVDENDLKAAFLGTLRSEIDEAPVLVGAFADAYARFEVLRERYVTRQIEAPEFGRAMTRLRVIDENGWRWTIGATTGNWYRRVAEGTPWSPAPVPTTDGRFEYDEDFEYVPQQIAPTPVITPAIGGADRAGELDGPAITPSYLQSVEEESKPRRRGRSQANVGGGPRIAGQQLIDLIDQAVNIEEGTSYDPNSFVVETENGEAVGGILGVDEALPDDEPFWHQPLIGEDAQAEARRRSGQIDIPR